MDDFLERITDPFKSVKEDTGEDETDSEYLRRAVEKQGEISFKVGYEEGRLYGKSESLLSKASIDLMVADSKKAGIQEVVEWIQNHGGGLDGFHTEWQAKLKEWGLEEEVKVDRGLDKAFDTLQKALDVYRKVLDVYWKTNKDSAKWS